MTERRQLSVQQIRIGIIGTQTIVDKIMKVIETFPSFDPVPLVFQDDGEAPALAERIGGEVEVLFLSDPLTQRKVKELGQFSIPVHYVPVTDAGLYKALFHAGRWEDWLAAYRWIL